MLGQTRVMVVSGGVIQKALDLFRGAVAGLATEFQPPLPIGLVIRFWIASDLIGEAEPTAIAQR